MSFDWNLSSDEEEGENFDEWAKIDLNSSSARRKNDDNDKDGSSSDDEEKEDDHPLSSSSHFAGVAFVSKDDEIEEDDDENDNEEDEDEVDWEDAGQEDDDSDGSKLASDPNHHTPTNNNDLPTLRPVTLDLNESTDMKDTNSKKKRMARKRYRYEQLTPDLQYLLSNLEKAHLLSLTATAMMVSNFCSMEENLVIAHSLIPFAWVRGNSMSTPTLKEIQSFCSFFFHLVHPALHLSAEAVTRKPRNWKRKTKKKTTTSSVNDARQTAILYRIQDYARFLSTRSGAPDLPSQLVQGDYNQYDEVQLFVSMTRSLGWRTRFVMALEPCQRDLDPDHSLFVTLSTKNVFQRLWKDCPSTSDSKRPAKRLKKEIVAVDPKSVETSKLKIPSMSAALNLDRTKRELPLCWVEVLCLGTTKKKDAGTAKPQWIHIDPGKELINTPDSVEVALHANHDGIPFSKSKKKRSIPYALAVEHVSLTEHGAKVRLADVTPRYASSFVDSLKARGVIRGKGGPIQDELRTDLWWGTVLKSMNSADHHRRSELRNKGKTHAEAITLDDDSDDGGGKPAAVENFNGNGKPPAVDVGMKEVDDQEEKQLQESKRNEPLPTSKTAFKTNPIYTLPSLLNANEVLKPDAKQRMCGIFKGEFVFRRSDVETAYPANKWLYRGYKVKETEMNTPIKRIKARVKTSKKTFQALKSYGVGQSNDGTEETRKKIIDEAEKGLPDGMESLFASWQTEPWSPSPVGPNDPIPVNEYNNIELALMNPGLVHIDERHVAKVAKKLGIPYVPCLLGFEGNGGNRTPTIRGIVVHQHNEDILREANQEMASHFLQEEHENRQRTILLRWKRLMVGVLTKKRLDEAYG